MTRRHVLVLLLGLGAISVGLGAEGTRFAWDEPVLWLPDLLVGWATVACGLIAIWRRPSGTGTLFIGAGLTWFLGTLPPSIRRCLPGSPRTLSTFTAASSYTRCWPFLDGVHR